MDMRVFATHLKDMEWEGKAGMWVNRWKVMGESAEYIEQNLIRTYLMDTGGFWELVRHFEDNEGNELNIECKLGRNVLCSIVRCVAGEEA